MSHQFKVYGEGTRAIAVAGRVAAFALAMLLLLPGCATAPAAHPDHKRAAHANTAAKDALYVELGGVEGITQVVDRFLARVDNDLRINLFFEQTDHKDLRNLVIEQFCEATGGPCKYSGRSMEEAHSGMNLSDADFAAFVEDLIAAMDELKVPKASQDKLLGLLGPMKPQVVGQ